jgi:hypothetical protein
VDTSSNLLEAVTSVILLCDNIVGSHWESKGDNASGVISKACKLKRLECDLRTIGHKPPPLANSAVPTTSTRFVSLAQSTVRIFPCLFDIVSGHKTSVYGRGVRLCDERLNSVANGDQGRLSISAIE